jgi:hypothetical protein
VRLAELAVAGSFVASKPSQLSSLDMEEGLVALRARHLEPGVGFRERVLDLVSCLEASELAKATDSGKLSRELPESGAAAPADGDRLLRESQGLLAIAEAETAITASTPLSQACSRRPAIIARACSSGSSASCQARFNTFAIPRLR